MIASKFRTRYIEIEAAKAKKGQLLPNGIYLDESDNSVFPCQVAVEDGVVYYQDECNTNNHGPATKTNVKATIASTKAYIRESEVMKKRGLW